MSWNQTCKSLEVALQQVDNVETAYEFVIHHKISMTDAKPNVMINSRGGSPKQKQQRGGTKVCVREDKLTSLPEELIQNIVKVLEPKQAAKLYMVSKAFTEYSLKNLEQEAGNDLYNLLISTIEESVQQSLGKLPPEEPYFAYGITIRDNNNNHDGITTLYYIVVSSTSVQGFIETRAKQATSQPQNKFTINVSSDLNQLKTHLSELFAPIKPVFETHPTAVHVMAAFGGPVKKDSLNTDRWVLDYWDEGYAKLRDITDTFSKQKEMFAPTITIFKGGAQKVFYKGYHYKIRTEGRKKFIQTKHEGAVSLAKVREWANKNKKGH